LNELKKEKFRVSFFQDGNLLNTIRDNTIPVDNRSFDIVIEFPEPMGIEIVASFEDSTYMGVVSGKSVNELKGFRNTGMAEGVFNESRDILISDDAPSYWYYTSPDEHRFNEVEITEEGYYRCTRTIDSLYLVDSHTSISVNEVHQPLFLVFMYTGWIENYTRRIAYSKYCIELYFSKKEYVEALHATLPLGKE
jgi:hypothetical protein